MQNIFIAIYVALYRLTKGKIGGRMSGTNVFLVTTTGRKSGKSRTVPLGVFDRQDGWVIVASNAGGPRNPAWFHNLVAQPQASVQAFGKVIPVRAELLIGEARAQAWQQVVTVAPPYARYETSTARQIPLILLHPQT